MVSGKAGDGSVYQRKNYIVMAKIYDGYLGGFSGKLGTAIGYNWNGRWCLRSLPAHVHNPRTERQQEHRMMFREEVRLAARMAMPVNLALWELGRASGMTSYNLFVKMNQPAFGWVDGALRVDWLRLRLSSGPVAPVALSDVAVDEHNVLNVRFEKNPLRVSASGSDHVYLFVYCPALASGYLASPVFRRSGGASLMLPDGYGREELKLYAIVCDERNRWSETAAAEWSPVAAETSDSLCVTDSSVGDDVDSLEANGLDGVDSRGVVRAADANVIVGPPFH